MSSGILSLLPVLLPLLGAAFALLAKSAGRYAGILERIGAFIGLALPLPVLYALQDPVLSGGLSFIAGGWDAAIGIELRFDGLAWILIAMGFLGAVPAYLYSRGAGPNGPTFTALFLIQTAAVAATAVAADLFNLFVCLEIMGLASYALIASSQKGGALLAAFSYLALSSAAMVLFLFGLFGLYRVTGVLGYRAIATYLSSSADGGGPTVALSIACIVAAVAIRVAIIPVYGWLPDAHALSPHAVSAVLSGVLIKTPLFALGRFLLHVPQGVEAMRLLGAAGAATALVAVAVALAQRDAKRLLAYHSISQIGYVVAAWGTVGIAGIATALFYAVCHAVFKALLFLSVGTIVDVAGDRDVYSLRGAAAKLRRNGDPLALTGLCFAVGALSIAAVPPFSGYAGKEAVLSLFGGSWQFWVLPLAGIGTTASFIKLAMVFLPANPTEPAAVIPSVPIHALALVPMVFFAFICVAFGIWSVPILNRMAALCEAAGFSAASPFYWKSIGKAALTLAAGIVLFFLASSRAGKYVAARIRQRPRSFAGLLFFLTLGLAAISVQLVLL